MRQQSDEDRVPDQAQQETDDGGFNQHAGRSSLRRGVVVVLLGAIVLGLGYALLSTGPAPASVSSFVRRQCPHLRFLSHQRPPSICAQSCGTRLRVKNWPLL